MIDWLKQVGPGHYQSTQPVPVWGTWKTLLRVQDGRTMTAVPIWAPPTTPFPHPKFRRCPPPLVRSCSRSRSCSANATRTCRPGCSPPAV
ncbi:hypothetical protein I552_5907 [Mycobacterium xenopi 3993]|nr:hypothetical protein I552_5907 [Mycobacterium xenopi 3993]